MVSSAAAPAPTRFSATRLSAIEPRVLLAMSTRLSAVLESCAELNEAAAVALGSLLAVSALEGMSATGTVETPAPTVARSSESVVAVSSGADRVNTRTSSHAS